LRDAQPALLTNWFELTITCNQKVIFQNSWICDHFITNNNVTELVDSGRARWKTENENHNVLKTKGYHIEHNFGHGKQHLASFLLTLNLLAFLFHTVLHLVDLPYQQIRSLLGTRKRFFSDLRTLTTYFIFNSWRHLISFMLDEFDPICLVNSS
ncbi:MAG: ISNCY family transposase, partial [Nostoc sp.]